MFCVCVCLCLCLCLCLCHMEKGAHGKESKLSVAFMCMFLRHGSQILSPRCEGDQLFELGQRFCLYVWIPLWGICLGRGTLCSDTLRSSKSGPAEWLAFEVTVNSLKQMITYYKSGEQWLEICGRVSAPADDCFCICIHTEKTRRRARSLCQNVPN